MSDDFFAPPPFKPQEALQRLHKDLGALGLTEREGRYERGGRAWVRASLVGAELQAAIVREPARSPDWQTRTLKSSADMRDFIGEVKKRLVRWNELDE